MRIIKMIANYVIKKIGFKHLFIVPPNSEFHTRDMDVSNKSAKCLQFLTREFDERRKEGRRNDTLGD